MPSAPNFEPAYIPPARQEMVSPISHQSKAVRNDGTPDEKKFLGINNEWGYSNPSGQIYDEDGYCCPAKNDWIIEKRYQLWIRLANVTHILVYKILYQQGYIVVRDCKKYRNKSEIRNICDLPTLRTYYAHLGKYFTVNFSDLDDNCEFVR
ncbi:hypothetical protein RhiirA5_419957 [Rhizophagus irregularis]|uniref:Uncharacterized protein n=1 Tax=Rhizophagus irregularis TaxID=588596 RepID=A0A2N0PH49_9GLOM|nr:hypothetical protein RhiirA5_419957 [Rhizophagus irregularis]